MKALIETYRGKNIYFDTEEEKFVVDLTDEKFVGKAGFNACKVTIDEYIKINKPFVPFQVRNNYYGELTTKTIVGIRKDGRFIQEGGSQFSSYDEGSYMLVDPLDDPIFTKIKELRVSRKVIDNEIADLEKSIHGKKLSEVKDELLEKYAIK